MSYLIYRAKLVNVFEAIHQLQEGEIVILPTDTVYGMAASLAHPQAISEIYEIKKRPKEKALLILAADLHQIEPYLISIPPNFYELAEAFWPGALTLVVPVDTGRIPSLVRAGKPTAGFRVPAHPLTHQILQEVGPVVAPSANMHGEPPPVSPDQITFDLPCVDGGTCAHAQPSTIVELHPDHWEILRKGAISSEAISEGIGANPLNRTKPSPEGP